MKEIDIEQRAAQAEANFRAGYNCAQSVYMAYADLFELDSTYGNNKCAFGGGMGRLREVCGACSGMFLVAGLAVPVATPKDREAKAANYKLVQELAAEFKAENGSYICRELLGLTCHTDSPIPEARTETYYKKRPCAQLVRIAAEIVGRKLAAL